MLTQYKSHSLDRHITTTWRLSSLIGDYVTPVPAQMRRGPHWFQGSADAIYQSLNLIYDERPRFVCVFGADHIYRMDPRQMVEQHIAIGAGVTVAGIRVPIENAGEFGVIELDGDARRIRRFHEKPSDAAGLAGGTRRGARVDGQLRLLADVLIDAVTPDAADDELVARHRGQHHPGARRARRGVRVRLRKRQRLPARAPDRGYWRDVGSLDAFPQAHMDLLSAEPAFDLYDAEWPILTWPDPLPPARLVFAGRIARLLDDSLLSAGVVVSGGSARLVLSPGVHLHSHAHVEARSSSRRRRRVGCDRAARDRRQERAHRAGHGSASTSWLDRARFACRRTGSP